MMNMTKELATVIVNRTSHVTLPCPFMLPSIIVLWTIKSFVSIFDGCINDLIVRLFQKVILLNGLWFSVRHFQFSNHLKKFQKILSNNKFGGLSCLCLRKMIEENKCLMTIAMRYNTMLEQVWINFGLGLKCNSNSVPD